ncbi:MAG: ribosome maturation factor RimP [Breznakia sp.]
MGSIDKLKELILPLTQKANVELYDVEWVQEGNMKILQVSIVHTDGKMDVDTCAEVSNKISDMLDEKDFLDFEYYLEVCSPGAERELRNDEEIRQAIDRYVYLKFKDPTAGMHEVSGFLKTVMQDSVCIEYMAKNIKKKIEVARDNISYIRLAVKL